MIVIRNLTHTYPGTRKVRARNALIDLSMDVREGEFTILSGPNGSGKSSLFRILCGLTLPSTGTITIAGHDLIHDAAPIRSLMGVVFQSPAVDKHLTVIENIRLHAALHGLKGAERAARIEESLSWTDIKTRLDDKVESLSGGLQRQVELAKCLLTRPRLLILDEPTTGLDPNSRHNFLSALRTIQRERSMTVFMTTHIFSEAEDADRVAILKEGRLMALDTPQALRARIGREMVVLQPTDPVAMQEKLSRDLHLTVRRYGEELRLEETENGASLPVLERILEKYRSEIVSISIKQPSLEDVFVHVTGGAVTAAEEQAAEIRTGT